MDGMGNHSHPNGHRGEDGAAAVATLAPLSISPALHFERLVPVSQVTHPDAPKTPKWRQVTHFMATHRGWLAAVPIVLVNAVAFGAQLGFWRAHVPLVAEAVLVALALESIAVYLAWEAHLAQLADDSALRLRLAAYGTAFGIGILNYSHFMLPGWRPTVEAVTFGMMSAISPWLWSVHSRRVSRDALKERGLIEPHAVRLGGTRWAWHPWRSVRVMSAATWAGETDPAKAIGTWQPRKAPKASPEASPAPAPEAVAHVPRAPVADAGQKPRKRASAPTARSRALAALRANPALSDAEAMKRAKASRATVQRARKELAGASS